MKMKVLNINWRWSDDDITINFGVIVVIIWIIFAIFLIRSITTIGILIANLVSNDANTIGLALKIARLASQMMTIMINFCDMRVTVQRLESWRLALLDDLWYNFRYFIM